MDGNGRWAKSRGLPRIAGHQEGVRAVRRVTRASGELGVKFLTMYTFSAENWKRPKREVNALMNLFIRSLHEEIENLNKNNVRFMAIGDFEQLPDSVLTELKGGMEYTANNTGLVLNLAFNYGSRQEISKAVKQIAEAYKSGSLRLNQIDKNLIASHLYTSDLPDPDLLIRTGGEFRVSNFLLWQLAYTELYFTETYWPSFSKRDLVKAIEDFQCRERRFGKISEQVVD